MTPIPVVTTVSCSCALMARLLKKSMTIPIDGTAIIYCEGAFNTPNGKTAHGLVRFTDRYRVIAVVDSRYAGQDSGEIIDNKPNGIPVVATIEDAVNSANSAGTPATHLVVGLAPDGGRLAPVARLDIKRALELGLDVDSGLHDFLSEDTELAHTAAKTGSRIRDVRRPPDRRSLHFFSGDIESVTSLSELCPSNRRLKRPANTSTRVSDL